MYIANKKTESTALFEANIHPTDALVKTKYDKNSRFYENFLICPRFSAAGARLDMVFFGFAHILLSQFLKTTS